MKKQYTEPRLRLVEMISENELLGASREHEFEWGETKEQKDWDDAWEEEGSSTEAKARNLWSEEW